MNISMLTTGKFEQENKVARLSLVVAALVILLIISFTYFTTQVTRNNVLDVEKNNMANTTRLLSERIQRIIFNIDLQVSLLQEEIEAKGLRSSDEIFALSSSRIYFDKMQDLLVKTADVDALGIVDAEGRLVNSRQWPAKAVNISNRTFFKILRDEPKRPYFVTSAINSKLTKEKIFIFSRRLTSRDGSFLGIINGANSISRFNKSFLNSLPDNDATLHLLKHDGSILVSQSKAENSRDQSAAIWRVAGQKILNVDDTNLSYMDGPDSSIKRLVSLHNVSGYPLTVAFSRSESAVLEQWQKQAWLNSLFAIITSLLVVLASWVYRKQVNSKEIVAKSAADVKIFNQRLNEAQRLAKVGSWELDLDSGDLFWTDEMYLLFEIDKTKFNANYEAFLEAIHPDDRDSVNTAYTKSLKDRSPYAITHRSRMADGRIKWIEERCDTDFDADGKPLISRGTTQDISERIHAQKQLQRLNAELEKKVKQRTSEMEVAMTESERANAAKSDFLSRMSHELRTPLNAILGFGQLLQLEKEPPLTQSQASNVDEILEGGNYLLALVDEILDLSRIERGLLVVSLEPVPVLPMLEACIKQIKPLAAKRDIVLSLDPFVPSTVNADVIRLKEVLFNLLSNAVKYNRIGGSIRVSCVVNGQRLRIRVQDTGTGISSESLPRLFEPFERLESSYTGIDGVGIGLALVKKLVQGMNGEIGMESVIGEGSTFWFELPISNTTTHKKEETVSVVDSTESLAK